MPDTEEEPVLVVRRRVGRALSFQRDKEDRGGSQSAVPATEESRNELQRVVPATEGKLVPGNIREVYGLDDDKKLKLIGEGRFGRVTLIGEAPDSGDVCKTIAKDRIEDPADIIREIHIHQKMQGKAPSLIAVHEDFGSSGPTKSDIAHGVHLVMERCSFDMTTFLQRCRLDTHHMFREWHAAFIFHEVLELIAHAHSLGIVIADVKPENFLFHVPESRIESLLERMNLTDAEQELINNPELPVDEVHLLVAELLLHRKEMWTDKIPGFSLLVTDFGLSQQGSPGKRFTEFSGTVGYLAPEQYDRDWSFSVDLWAAGVILAVLLTGSQPYKEEQDVDSYAAGQTTKSFKVSDFTAPGRPGADISEAARALLESLLQQNAADRSIQASLVMCSDWRQTALSDDKYGPSVILPTGAKVQTKLLNAKPELNGKEATVIGFNKDTGRYQLDLGGDTRISVKPQNLVVPTSPDRPRIARAEEVHKAADEKDKWQKVLAAASDITGLTELLEEVGLGQGLRHHYELVVNFCTHEQHDFVSVTDLVMGGEAVSAALMRTLATGIVVTVGDADSCISKGTQLDKHGRKVQRKLSFFKPLALARRQQLEKALAARAGAENAQRAKEREETELSRVREDAKRLAEVEASRIQEEAKRRAEAKVALDEAKRQAGAEADKIREEAKRKAAEEAARILDEAKRQAEIEASRILDDARREAKADAARLLDEARLKAMADAIRVQDDIAKLPEAQLDDLQQLLLQAGSDDNETLWRALEFCKQYGATSISDLCKERKGINDFIDALSLKTVQQRKLRDALMSKMPCSARGTMCLREWMIPALDVATDVVERVRKLRTPAKESKEGGEGRHQIPFAHTHFQHLTAEAGGAM